MDVPKKSFAVYLRQALGCNNLGYLLSEKIWGRIKRRSDIVEGIVYDIAQNNGIKKPVGYLVEEIKART